MGDHGKYNGNYYIKLWLSFKNYQDLLTTLTWGPRRSNLWVLGSIEDTLGGSSSVTFWSLIPEPEV